MSKVFKGVVKVVKKVFKGVKKVFKKIIKSPLGKVLMIGAAIYTGGVALGAWGSTGPLSGMYGVLGGGGAAGGASAGAAGGGGAAITSAAPALAAEITTVPLGAAAAAAPAVSALAPAAAVSAAAPVVELGAGAAMQGLGQAAPSMLAATGNYVSAAASGMAGFAKANPLITAMGLQGVATALTPDVPNQVDVMREEDRIRQERFGRLRNVSDVDLGMSSGGPQQRLQTTSGMPWHERLKLAGGR